MAARRRGEGRCRASAARRGLDRRTRWLHPTTYCGQQRGQLARPPRCPTNCKVRGTIVRSRLSREAVSSSIFFHLRHPAEEEGFLGGAPPAVVPAPAKARFMASDCATSRGVAPHLSLADSASSPPLLATMAVATSTCPRSAAAAPQQCKGAVGPRRGGRGRGGGGHDSPSTGRHGRRGGEDAGQNEVEVCEIDRAQHSGVQLEQ